MTEHPDAVRAPIEREHSTNRAQREQQYVDDRVKLEEDYRKDIADIESSRREALTGGSTSSADKSAEQPTEEKPPKNKP